jgi:O-succinylbenzoate synthase
VEPSARWFVDDYVAPPLELSAPGLFSVPARPGLGFQVDPAKVRRYQVRQTEITTRSPN